MGRVDAFCPQTFELLGKTGRKKKIMNLSWQCLVYVLGTNFS